MTPVLFTARDGVVLFRCRPIPDWTAHKLKRAIRDEGLEAPMFSPAFPIWREAYEQLRDAIFHANNQRRLAPTPPRAA